MAGVAAALTAFFLYVAGVISEPARSDPLCGPGCRATPRRSPPSSTRMNVTYDAKGDGGTILVPADQVTKLRMELASRESSRRRRRL